MLSLFFCCVVQVMIVVVVVFVWVWAKTRVKVSNYCAKERDLNRGQEINQPRLGAEKTKNRAQQCDCGGF